MHIIVLGAANIDYLGVAETSPVPGVSNPGRIGTSLGGVARNVAENLARLGCHVSLCTALGDDHAGRLLRENAAMHDITLHAHPASATSSYIAIFGPDGEDIIGIADTGALESIDEAGLDMFTSQASFGDIVVIEGNLPAFLLEEVFKTATGGQIYADAVSPEKAGRLYPFLGHIDVLKATEEEVEALGGAEHILSQGTTLYMSRGKAGVTHVNTGRTMRLDDLKVVRTQGAGDALLAGIIYGELKGVDALRYGMAAAALTLKSPDAVSPSLTVKMLEKEARHI